MHCSFFTTGWQASVPLAPIPGDPTQPIPPRTPPYKSPQPQPIHDPDPAGPPIELPPDAGEPTMRQ